MRENHENIWANEKKTSNFLIAFCCCIFKALYLHQLTSLIDENTTGIAVFVQLAVWFEIKIFTKLQTKGVKSINRHELESIAIFK